MKTRHALLEFAFILLVILTFDTVIYFRHLQRLYPLGDEFSLIVESGNASLQWLLDGYSNYFNVYPEFFVPYTNFIRPVANAMYWIFSPWTESGYKIQLIIFSYGVHAAIPAVLYLYSRRVSGNSIQYSFILSLAAFLVPAFWCSPMPLYPSFTLDGFAAFLCLLGIIMLTTRAAWVGLILLTLAIFTKETALPVLAAVAMYSLLVRRKGLLVASLSIFILWSGLRWLAFGTSGGTYALNEETWSSIILRGSGLLRLPVSNTFSGHLMDFFTTGTINGPFVFLLINSLALILFVVIVSRFCSRSILPFRTIPSFLQLNNYKQHLFIILLISTIFSAVFFSLIAGNVRFSYVFFICFLGVLTVCQPNTKLHYYLLAILIVASAISDLYSLKNTRSNTTALDMKFSASRKLIAKISAIGNIDKQIFIVGDFISGYSKRESLAKLSGVTTHVLGGISIELNHCDYQDVQQIYTVIMHNGENSKTLKVALPKCASFIFEGANSDLIHSHLKNVSLNRSPYIDYDFPYLVWNTKNKASQEFGKVAVIHIRNSSAIYFDFNYNEWIYVP